MDRFYRIFHLLYLISIVRIGKIIPIEAQHCIFRYFYFFFIKITDNNKIDIIFTDIKKHLTVNKRDSDYELKNSGFGNRT